MIPAAAISADTVLRPGGHVGSVEVEGNLVLVDEHGGRGFALNSQATLIWRCLDGLSPLAEIIDDLSHVYGVEPNVMVNDVLDVARVFGALGLLEGIAMHLDAVPTEIHYVDEYRGEQTSDGTTRGVAPTYDDRYLAVPPNF